MSSEDYGKEGSGGDDLGSDFGELDVEYEVDDEGNPLNAKGTVSSSTEVKTKVKAKPEE
jgi:hypothetical protein